MRDAGPGAPPHLGVTRRQRCPLDGVVAQLHVAALPFPSPQGTQAALRFMLEALRGAGVPVRLLTYPHGQGPPPAGIPIERLLPLPPVRSLRSGPSLGKVLLDAQLLLRLRRRLRRRPPGRLIAHHVEAAAAAALAAPGFPFAFFAHTALGPELPSYLPRRVPAGPLRAAGEQLDRWLLGRARWTLAISPALAVHLERLGGRPVSVVPPPWPLPAPLRAEERAEARQRLGLLPEHEVLLYAGNLDAYQGWEELLVALARLAPRRPRIQLLIATASAPEPVLRLAGRLGVLARLRLAPLGHEADRRRAHAAADVALVPRVAPGGLPVKLLDGLARGLPLVAARRAMAGFPPPEAVRLVDRPEPERWTGGLVPLLDAPVARRQRLGEAGRAWVAEHFSAARFVERFERALRGGPLIT